MKKLLYKLAILASLLLLSIMCIIYKFDPMLFFKKSIDSSTITAYMGAPQHLYPQIIKKKDYSTVITGTSMCENFISSRVDNTLNVKSINMAVSGSSIYDQANLLRQILKSDNSEGIHSVVWGVDLFNLNRSYNLSNRGISEKASYLLNDGFLSTIKYLVDIEMLQNVKNRRTVNLDRISYWGDSFVFDSNELKKQWENPLILKKNTEFLGDINDTAYVGEANISKNIIEVVKSNPDIKFYIFIPPYSILALYQRGNILELDLKAKLYLAEKLEEYKNVEIYDFTALSDLTHNLDNYKDLTHYSPKINDYIIDCISKKENKADRRIAKTNNELINSQLINLNINELW